MYETLNRDTENQETGSTHLALPLQCVCGDVHGSSLECLIIILAYFAAI